MSQNAARRNGYQDNVMNVETFPDLPVVQPGIVNPCPSQKIFLEQVDRALERVPMVAMTALPGAGRSTLAAHVAARHGGKVIGLSDTADAIVGSAPGRMDEVIVARISEALKKFPLVVVDDFERILGLSTTERSDYLNKVIVPLLYDTAIGAGKKIVLSGASDPSVWWVSVDRLIGERAASLSLPGFTADDYAFIAGELLGIRRVADVDFRLVHRQAPMLDGYQIRLMCQLLSTSADLDTDDFLACLREWILESNIDLSEVEALSFDSLPGSEHIAEALETYVALPFENPKLAKDMGLMPKRGVLLYGPPGTGKTSIGRALARRMKGRFFMIDGTFLSEPPTVFFKNVQAVVAEAKANSPSVLFIDDADVLFGIGHIAGLERYLLSLLDGLESESARNVCVMMTAMDARRVPQALMRSGRVELWLETRLPDDGIRARILQRWLQEGDIPGHGDVDYIALARASEGFTPADLRRIVADAKLLYAADEVAGRPSASATEYLSRAIDDIIDVRARMAEQLGDDALRVGRAA